MYLNAGVLGGCDRLSIQQGIEEGLKYDWVNENTSTGTTDERGAESFGVIR